MPIGAARSTNGGWINASWVKGSWINRRLRAHGAILAICLWSVYGWIVATPGLRDRNGNLKGTDFSHLYTLGSVALTHRATDLYDVNAQAKLTAFGIPGAAGIAYIPMYPPQVSIFFAPLAALPYGRALIIWLMVSAVLYGICCYALYLACPHLRNEPWTVLLLAIAFPGFFHLIVWGQTSAMALACFTAAFFFLREEKLFLAGLALGCLAFKPQLGIAAAFIFLYTRAWRVIAGGIVSAAAQLALPAIYYGAESLRAWVRVMRSVAYNVAVLEPRPYQTHNLRIFWSLLIPGRALPFALYVVSALVILGVTVAVWTRPSLLLGVRYSALVLASVLVAPHLIVYDLVILAPVFLLMADWVMAQPAAAQPLSPGSAMKVILYWTYLAPLLSGPIARWTHLQISVVAMSGLLYVIWRSADGRSSMVVRRAAKD
ncbi:MAG TPA: glycosyltransferase family 87 protein [Terriglobales bacterium]